jgi:hypothetical protein
LELFIYGRLGGVYSGKDRGCKVARPLGDLGRATITPGSLHCAGGRSEDRAREKAGPLLFGAQGNGRDDKSGLVATGSELLLQLRVLRLGLLQDGHIAIRIFPQPKEILVRGTRFRCVALLDVGAPKFQVRKRIQYVERECSAMI